jgi:hypothetical protein
MKKIFLIALAVAVLFTLPLTAQAKTEFELGGYIRLDSMWSSSNAQSYTLSNYVARDNVANVGHGKFLMNANASRFNLTIKGPELWGGKVTGFIEMDFDGQVTTTTANQSLTTNAAGTTTVNASQRTTNSASFNQAQPRLRHAMFKINWSEQELLFGQYWSINSELIPDTADSGGYCLYGATQLRIPQIRYTQKFGNGFDGSLAIESPQNGRWGLDVDTTNNLEGETSETPMVEAKARFEQDLYGKAAWYGKPRGFYVGLGTGYFRSRNQPVNFLNTAAGTTWNTLGQTGFVSPIAQMTVNNMRYHDHWLFLLENFTPIIPTVSKDLAGTLGLAHQWWVGQGVSAWRLDLPGNDRFYAFNGNVNNNAATPGYDMSFIKRYGGWAQLQYYWTNEIFTNANFGFEKAFGFNNARDVSAPGGFSYANPIAFDPIRTVWRAGVTQWYRPVAAVKFGLQYTWSKVDYFQFTTVPANGNGFSNQSNVHNLFANAWYFF